MDVEDVQEVVEIEQWPETVDERVELLTLWPAEYLVTFALSWTRGEALGKPSE